MIVRRLAGWVVTALVLLISVAVGALGTLRVSAALRETHTAAELAPAGGRRVATTLGEIFVVEEGPAEGLPLLLFHGTAGWSALWKDTQAALAAAGFRSIAFDIPPFGFSDRPIDGKYDRTTQSRRVVALLDALRLDRVILVGHSYGGGPAVETALRHPERVAALVLMDVALGLDAGADAKLPFALANPFVREVLLSATVTNPLLTRLLLSSLLARKDSATESIAAMLRQPMTISGTTPKWAAGWKHSCRAMSRHSVPIRGTIPALRCRRWSCGGRPTR